MGKVWDDLNILALIPGVLRATRAVQRDRDNLSRTRLLSRGDTKLITV